MARKTEPWVFAALAAALALGPLTGCDSGPSDAQYVEQARAIHDKGDPRAAAIQLKNALRLNPDNAEARWLSGKVLLEVGDAAGAEKELRRARELGVAHEAVALPLIRALLLQGQARQLLDEPMPTALAPADRAEWYVLRSRAWLALGDAAKAEAELAKIRREDAETPSILLGQATLALGERNWDQARNFVERALARAPDSAEAWSLRADLHRLVGEGEAAEAAYGRAIERNADPRLDLTKRASVRLGLGKLDEAKADLDRLPQGGRQVPEVMFLRGVIAYRQGQRDAAQSALEEALRLDGRHLGARFYLGAMQLAQRNLGQAELYLAQAVEAMPRWYEANRLLATVHFARGDLQRAETQLIPFTDVKGDPQLLALRGAVRLGLGKSEAALEDLRERARLEPDSARAQLEMGMALIAARRQQEGVDALQRALALDPKLRKADTQLIEAHLRIGELEQALTAVVRWRQRLPEDVGALNYLGAVRARQDDIPQAQAAFAEASTRDPADVQAARNLARLDLDRGDRESAKARFRVVLERAPGNAAAAVELAQLEAAGGDVDAAIRVLERVNVRDPHAYEPVLLLARYRLERGQAGQALALLQPFGDEHRSEPVYLLALGQSLLAAGQASNAADSFEQLRGLMPDSAQVAYLAAKAHAAAGDGDKMRAALRRALELQPDNLLAAVAMSQFLARSGQLEQAGGVLEPAERLHPGNDALAIQRAMLALAAERPAEAVERLRAVQQRTRGESRPAVMLLAQAEARAGQSDAAIATLAAWLGRHPQDRDALNALAARRLDRGELAEAAVVFERIRALAPDDVVALNNLAMLLKGDAPAKALGYARRAAELAPGAPAVLDTLGQLLLAQGQVEQAVRVLREAYARAPGNAEIGLHLADALRRAEAKPEAKQLLQQIIDQGGDRFAEPLRSAVLALQATL